MCTLGHPCLHGVTASKLVDSRTLPMGCCSASRPMTSHVCYDRGMVEVASRELRNSTRSLLDRVEGGETVVITVDGRPVARLEPVGRRPRWVSRDEFLHDVLRRQADPAMAADLAALSPDTTDDIPLR